jgi:predicted transcriptional regulator
MKLKWRDDADAMAVLSFIGVTSVIREIALSEVDWAESSNNCARLAHPLNNEKIEEYHRSMECGDVFPRIVVESTKTGFVILGGNQRMAAVKRFDGVVATVDAYVTQPLTEANREVVIRSMNSRHGWGSEKEERLEHAQYLVRRHGFSAADVARLLAVSPTAITDRIRAEDVRASLARKGVDSSLMSQGSLNAIGRVKNERAAVTLAKAVVEHRVPVEKLVGVVKQVESAKSISEITKDVNAFVKEVASSVNAEQKSAGRMRSPRRDRFMRKLEDLSMFLERGNDGSGFSSMSELQCTRPDDSDKIGVLATKIILRLKTIARIQ